MSIQKEVKYVCTYEKDMQVGRSNSRVSRVPWWKSPSYELNKWLAKNHSRFEPGGEEINCLFLRGIRPQFLENPVLKLFATSTALCQPAYGYVQWKTISDSDHTVYSLQWKVCCNFFFSLLLLMKTGLQYYVLPFIGKVNNIYELVKA